MPRLYTPKKNYAHKIVPKTISDSSTVVTFTNDNSDGSRITNGGAAVTATNVLGGRRKQHHNGGEWKGPAQQKSHTTLQQSKEETPGPVSPTEASVAPIYYNNTHENKDGKLTFFFCVLVFLLFVNIFIFCYINFVYSYFFRSFFFFVLFG